MSQALFERIRLILQAQFHSSYHDVATLLRDGAASASELQLRALLDACKAELGLLLVQAHHQQQRRLQLQASISTLQSQAKAYVHRGDETTARELLLQQIDVEQQLADASSDLEPEIQFLSASIEALQQRLQPPTAKAQAPELQELDALVKQTQLEQKLAALRKESPHD